MIYKSGDSSPLHDTSKQTILVDCCINLVLHYDEARRTDRDMKMTSESYKQQLYPAYAHSNQYQIMLSFHLGPVAE